MNEKFFTLPEEKRQAILNAGFRVFSQNSYKKSPMQEIADRAGVSKSLLFHYFCNKKELYLFLWDQAARRTVEYLTRYGCYESSDLFEMMERGMQAKLTLMRVYPDMSAFAVKAFYEKDVEINSEIQKSYRHYFALKAKDALARLNPEDFIPGLDLTLMYREMYLASEGYLWEIFQTGERLDVDMLERDFENLLRFWKSIYLRREE
ncbi:MAG: TetR/AcrR family transcriptional regulator [Lachnospiraceae bacterium]|jgi:TetR/AcrR family transcriptional regulator|nr:TetR/AcrR family transcriptional regulator [Lachnospiraceae bacterium]